MRLVAALALALSALTFAAPAHARHHGRGESHHHQSRPHSRHQARNVDRHPVSVSKAPEKSENEALAWADRPIIEARPYRLTGLVHIADASFPFVSGGAGRGSIPYGDWPITPKDVGKWGARHGAIGLNHGDDMPDKRIGKPRDGIEIHAAHSDHTDGCVGILRDFDALKHKIQDMIAKFGDAWLHVGPTEVWISPQRL